MKKISDYFDENLAEFLAEKITAVYPDFQGEKFSDSIKQKIQGEMYSARMVIFAQALHRFLPENYNESCAILEKILGEENPNQTGTFSVFYWTFPIAKFVEMFGLEHFETSVKLIEKITKRSTAEFAVRPFIKKYPEKMLEIMKSWAISENFHLRRLASEGLRPKLPWANKLDIFVDNPTPVFEILELLKEDAILYVKKSVGNHLADWLKINPEATKMLLKKWENSQNIHTQWIIRRANRYLVKKNNKKA